MPTLNVDSSPPRETPVSQELTRHFVAEWKARNPSSSVIVRNLSLVDIPPVSAG